MKTKLLLSCLLAGGLAVAQGQVYTTPVGYVTEELNPGFNLIGITVHGSTAIAGEVTSVDGNDVILDGVDIEGALPEDRLYVLEVLSGTAEGVIQEFDEVDFDVITLPAPIGVAAGDAVRVRVAPTLEEIFGDTLTSATTAGGSDIVWVAGGVGVFDRYYKQAPFFGGDPVWTKINPDGTQQSAPNTPVVFLDGIFVEVRSTAKDLVLSGEVRLEATSTSVGTGFNALGTIFPVGLTLENSGLESQVQSATTVGGSDVIWNPVGAGTFERFFLQAPFFGGDPEWRRVNPDGSLTTVDPSTIELSSAVFVERRGAPAQFVIESPPYN